MFHCSKTYLGVPFAHRQPKHEGHCRLIHGHNWGFKFTFGCSSRDDKGFVVDFGGLKFLREWLDGLDHAFVVNEDDPELERFSELATLGLCRVVVVKDSSREGMARLAFQVADQHVQELTTGRVWVSEVVCTDGVDSSATYSV